MRTGTYRHRLTFQRPAAVLDEWGQEAPGGWEDVATVWASIRPMGSSERLAAAQMQSAQTHVLQTHWRADIAAANGAWRVLFGTRRLGIVGLPRNVGEANHTLIFDCVERVDG